MDVLVGLVLLFVAGGLATAAGAAMITGTAVSTGPRSMDGAQDPPRVRDEDGSVTVLVLGSLAVALAATGAAAMSSGELSMSGLTPFVMAVLVVLTPLAVTVRWARRRPGDLRRPSRRL